MKKEFFASSVEEAVNKAAKKLGMQAGDLSYHVIEQEFKKAPGKMCRAIVVEVEEGQLASEEKVVTFLDAEEEKDRAAGDARWAAAFCKGVLGRMGISSRAEVLEKGDKAIIEIDLSEEGPDLRRGRSRELRGAIQHLVNQVLSHNNDSDQRFIVDIGGSLVQRTAKMERLANYLGEKTAKAEQTINIYMMDSQDRRLLHESLVEREGVTTQGMGDKQFRILSILPSSQK
ncbi:MAG TPA: Jag N-terminal domain-containing protein [Myxococcota bacterium]|nr:Jag N-terminal domain-containing protein [Myxococcota bacterium]